MLRCAALRVVTRKNPFVGGSETLYGRAGPLSLRLRFWTGSTFFLHLFFFFLQKKIQNTLTLSAHLYETKALVLGSNFMLRWFALRSSSAPGFPVPVVTVLHNPGHLAAVAVAAQVAATKLTVVPPATAGTTAAISIHSAAAPNFAPFCSLIRHQQHFAYLDPHDTCTFYFLFIYF